MSIGVLLSDTACEIEESRGGAGTALDFSLELVNGSMFDAAEFFGSVVLVNFWDTNCGACHAEQDDLNRLYADFHEQGFEIIGVALAQHGRAAVETYLQEYSVVYTSAVIGAGVEAQFGRPATIPRSIFVDRNGAVSETLSGGRDYDEFAAVLLPLLGN